MTDFSACRIREAATEQTVDRNLLLVDRPL
jgi:hypothetical protein